MLPPLHHLPLPLPLSSFPSISQTVPPIPSQHVPPATHCVRSLFPDRSALVLCATLSMNICVCVCVCVWCEGTGCLGPNVSAQGGALQDGKGPGHSQHKETNVFTDTWKEEVVMESGLCSDSGFPLTFPRRAAAGGKHAGGFGGGGRGGPDTHIFLSQDVVTCISR